MSRTWSWVLLMAAMTACHRPGSDGAAAPVANSASPRESVEPPGDEPRTLCLANPGGSAAADTAVRAAQKRALGLPARAQRWVDVGSQWVRKARLASDPGFHLNVEGCVATALAVEPDHAPALGLRGLALLNDHRFEEARRLAEELLARDRDDVMALGFLSDALLELGRYEEAALVAQRQVAAWPGMASYARGSYLRWLNGDGPRAKVLVREALHGRDPRDPEPAAWTFVEAAALFWHEADLPGADAVYAEALKWVPGYPAALVGRARVAMARNAARQAVDLLERAYAARPLAETAWLLGDAREMLGDHEGAGRAYDLVVRQGRRGDKLTLALFYATKDRDHEEALRLVEEERASRGGIYLDDVHAWALFRLGRTAEARAASERALRLGTQDARLLYHAGAIRVAMGDAAGGRRLVRRALALNPHFDRTGAAEARALLEPALPRVASGRS
jgi:tetratricopeptide (TPR) repeat protein